VRVGGEGQGSGAFRALRVGVWSRVGVGQDGERSCSGEEARARAAAAQAHVVAPARERCRLNLIPPL
jgi:hypothetical protein